MEASESISTSRAKRQKIDRRGRSEAFEKLKKLKNSGLKHKVEVNNVENVYDTVDEKEYSEKVLQRQDDDWIVDDGSGYFEDGREIFDDDLDAESVAAGEKNRKKHKKTNQVADTPKAKGSIRNMFANMSAKKKAEVVSIDDDAILAEVLAEVHSENNVKSSTVPKKPSSSNYHNSERNAAKEYMKSFSAPIKKSKPKSVSVPKLHSTNAAQWTTSEDRIVIETDLSQQDIVKIETYPSQRSQTKTEIENIYSQDDIKKESKVLNSVEVETEDLNLENFEDDFQMDCGLESTMEAVEATHSKSVKMEIKDSDPVIKKEVPDMEENELDFLNKMDGDEFLSGWEKMQNDQLFENNVEEQNKFDASSYVGLPLVKNSEGEKVFRFYWWDAFEDPFKPGIVYLFGKVYIKEAKTYVSCCVSVRNIERKVFILPRQFHHDLKTNTPTNQEVTMTDVYNEFSKKYSKGNQFRSRQVEKLYCFTLSDIPEKADYLEVRYPPEQGKILQPQTQAETFNYVFGTDTNFLELLLIDRKMKGPCWLDIKTPKLEDNPVSWCKLEVRCEKTSQLSVTNTGGSVVSPPPLAIATINLRTVLNPKNMQNEIVMISCMVHSEFALDKPAPNPPYQQHFCAISQPSGQAWLPEQNEALRNYKHTKVQKCDSERGLLSYFLAMFLKHDPDLIVGHDLVGYQLDTLFHRLGQLKIGNWSRLGKLKRKVMPTRIRNIQTDAVPGRLVCDLKISAKELIKSRSFDLNTLCMTVLKMSENQRYDFEQDKVRDMYETSKGLIRLITLTMQDTAYIIKLICELNVMPLALQITNISGFVLSKTLLGGRSERNEYLLLHAFTEKNYIVPDKFGQKFIKDDPDEPERNETTSSRKKPAYSGGLVLDPKVGFYDKLILLMDFNSLYPSIIQEYNICFTTMSSLIENSGTILTPNANSEPGILPIEIRKLVESRRQVKQMMKNPDISNELKMQYNIRQLALKLTANSMYGCLGFSKSRFYAQPLAAAITHKGREILTQTKETVQKLCYDVIYGDTDSVMINTNCLDYDQVFKIGVKIKQEVNKMYRQVELDIDGVFRYLLLLKKKKYAALTVSKNKSGEFVYQQEIKGLDIVRRDWSQLAAEAGKVILNYILSEQSPDERINNIHLHLTKLKEDLLANKVPISLLAITKQLTRDPTTYADKKSLPHVQVAIRYNSKGGKRLRQGDTVSYVICEDETGNSAVQRAYHIDELKNSETLKIDTNYYLAQQIHPIVSRLCEPIDGIEPDEIANTLGLDPNSYKKTVRRDINSDVTVTSSTNKFVGCDSFVFKCSTCQHQNEIKSPFYPGLNEYGLIPVLEKCGNKECDIKPIDYIKSVQNQLVLAIRKYITKYYATELICEDPACTYVTRNVPKIFAKYEYPVCRCEKGVMFRDYTDEDLYLQLSYFVQMFDLGKIQKKPILSDVTENGYHLLKETVEKYLAHSNYSVVDLSKIFNTVFNKTQAPLEIIEEDLED